MIIEKTVFQAEKVNLILSKKKPDQIRFFLLVALSSSCFLH